MAEAAVKSYPETTMKCSSYYGITNLKDVDQALTAGRANDGNIEEYLAQDFWVYVGSRHGNGLEYLHGILATGGVNRRKYDFTFATIFHEPFRENYWGWVKNQSLENIEEDEAQCWNEMLPGVSEEGVRVLSNISEFKRYFFVVANVTTDADEAYYLAIE